MQTLETRVSRLEAAANPSGPLLISWRLDPDTRAARTRHGVARSEAHPCATATGKASLRIIPKPDPRCRFHPATGSLNRIDSRYGSGLRGLSHDHLNAEMSQLQGAWDTLLEGDWLPPRPLATDAMPGNQDVSLMPQLSRAFIVESEGGHI